MTTSETSTQTVHDRIFGLLKASGIAERNVRPTLAKLCGISHQAVYQWFSTTKTMRPEHLLAIAREYHTTIEWLLTGHNPQLQCATVLDPRQIRQETLALFDPFRETLVQLSESLETTDSATAYKLLKIAMAMNQLKDTAK